MPSITVPTVAAVVGATATAGSAISSIAKGAGSGGTQSAANAAGQQADDFRQQAADLYNNLQQPTFDTTPLQGQTWLQDYAPQVYTPYTPQQSFMSDDPASLAAQQQALAQMQALAKGGLQPADLVALQQIQQQQAGAASSQNAATMANMQARGLGGAGATLAATLAGNQGAANSANSLYAQAMQAAMNRQTSAIGSAANTAGAIRQQSDSVSQQMAAMNNSFNEQIAQIRNAAALNAQNTNNAAQAANLAGRQGVANTNVATGNQNIGQQNTLTQQSYQDLLQKIAGQSNALNGQATAANATQAALNNQALGQQNSLNTGLTGLANLADKAGTPGSGLNNLITGSGGSSSTSGFTDNGLLFDGVNTDGTFNV